MGFLFFLFVLIPSNTLAVGESCDTRASECCTPPPIVVVGGGCDTGEYWIGDASTGYCRASSTTCGAAGDDTQSFSCVSGACVVQPKSNATPSTPLCGGDSGKVHLGGSDVNNCAAKVNVIQDPAAPSVLKAWLGQMLGSIVYIFQSSTTTTTTTTYDYVYNSGPVQSGWKTPRCPCDTDSNADDCDQGFYGITLSQAEYTALGADKTKCWDQTGGNFSWEFDYSDSSSTTVANVCGDKDSPTWDATQKKWVCAQGGGLWSKGGSSYSYSQTGIVKNAGNVPLPTSLCGCNAGDIVGINCGVTYDAGSTDYGSYCYDQYYSTGLYYWIEYQRTVVSNNNISNTNAGNVGIGTAGAPTAKLDVNGEIKGWGMVPVGTIISWYCSSATVNSANCNALLPSNWKVCDGSTVSDAASPFNGRALPNLVDKFVRGGKADYTDFATTGGANSQTTSITGHSHTVNSHTHTIPAHTHTLSAHTHTLPAHSHTIATHTHSLPGHTHGLGNHTQYLGSHRHRWSAVDPAGGNWGYWFDGSLNWIAGMEDGFDGEGSGIYYMGRNTGDGVGYWYTDYVDVWSGGPNSNSTSSYSGTSGSTAGSTDSVTPDTQGPSTDSTDSKPATSTGATSPGTNSVALTTDSYDNQPSYINFVKIIRIK